MKHIVIILAILISVSCKKKKVEPDPQPDPTPIETCQTGLTKFVGTYNWSYNSPANEIQIIFVSNRCPVKNSNNYIVKGLGEAVQNHLQPGQSFPIQDYVIYTNNEADGFAFGDGFSLKISGSNLILSSAKLVNSSYTLQRKP